MKKREITRLAEEVERLYVDGEYIDSVDSIAYKNASAIFIFDLEGNIKYSSGATSLTQQMPIRQINIDTTGIVAKVLESPSKKLRYTIRLDRFKSEIYVYGKVIPNTNACLVMLTSIDPIDATTTVLQSQLVYVTIIALLISSIISIFLSRRISHPIENMTMTANKLAQGNYDIEFEKAGYKEIDELADTLNYATAELAKTDKVRKELIANVSHDLKTPLTMIKAYSEMIRDLSGDNKEKREEHLQVIIDETDRLTRLVTDMMDLSKIESGLATLNKEVFNISEVMETISKKFEIMQNDKCTIKFDIPNDLYVLADKTKIEQVIHNLITNAINHSGKDCDINVKITANNKKVKVIVSDNGVGIPKEDLPYIWNRYYKSSDTFKRTTSGTGLGLSIVKNILDKHKSNYGVDSVEGKGATFYFDLERVNKKELKGNIKKENK